MKNTKTLGRKLLGSTGGLSLENLHCKCFAQLTLIFSGGTLALCDHGGGGKVLQKAARGIGRVLKRDIGAGASSREVRDA